MSLENDLKLLVNREMRSITSYLICLLKNTENKDDLLNYKYMCSEELQEALRRVNNNDSRLHASKTKGNEINRRLSIQDWARNRGVNVSLRRDGSSNKQQE